MLVAQNVGKPRLLIVFSVLKPVISDNVERICAHLIENAHNLPRSDHKKRIPLGKMVKGGFVFRAERRLVLG